MGLGVNVIIGALDKTSAIFKRVSGKIKTFAGTLKSKLGAMYGFAKRAATGIGVIGTAAVAAGAKAVSAYKTQAQAEAKLESVLKATGYAAGFTSGELKKQAAALQQMTGTGDETIISMQGMLASFKQIKGDQFQDATMAVLDMGAAMTKAGKSQGDVEAASIQVGKALNDPIKGLSALSRVGVTFTDQQKEQIKKMQESGDMAGAQSVILRELESEFGGTAKAMGEASHGTDQLKANFGDMVEKIGQAIVETDGFDGVIGKMSDGLKALNESGYIELWAENIQIAIKWMWDKVAPVLQKLGKALGAVKTGIQKSAAFVGGFTAAPGSFRERLARGREAAATIPEQMEQDTQLRLKRIKDEKREKERIKEEEERAAMIAAQKNKANEKANDAALDAAKDTTAEVEAQQDVEENKATTIADILGKREEADEIATESAEENLDIANQQLDVEKEILDTRKKASEIDADVSDTTDGAARQSVKMTDVGGKAITPEDVAKFGSFGLKRAASLEADRIKTIMAAIKEAQGDDGSKQVDLLQKIADNTTGLREAFIDGTSIS